MSPAHPYRNINLGPVEVPFELRPSPGKGWGTFATKKLIPGDLILEETTGPVVRKSLKDITESDVLSGFLRLPPHQKQQFLYLRDNGGREFTSMKQAFKENSFTVSTTHHAHGLFIVLSRFNHSCIPNCKIPMADNVIQKNDLQIYAIKTIMPGEELTFCYNPMYEYRTAKERAQRLGFQCDCKACLIGTPFQLVSDMRRVLMRGLYYIRRGEDIDGPTPGPGCTFRIDPEVKRAVEELTLPMSTRFIASILRAFLLEQEGLLDQFRVEILGLSNTNLVVASFKTASNARIAANVVAQESWMGKLCAAFRLYGKKDDADGEVAAVLRKKRMAEQMTQDTLVQRSR